MNIDWKIHKKRGNYRPVLTYTITLTEFEKSLAMPSVRITSTIPKPPETGWSHCWPDQHERADWTPSEYYQLMSPSHKAKDTLVTLKLPWRESNEYPEVEESLAALRDAFEEELVASMNSGAVNTQGSLKTSASAKGVIAPTFAAERILQSVARKTA
ncbi:hypothetical protein [Halodesulfovibrio spirochaetisodalis]|uniref:Uncharacterized protein n=1 Tax=Halodesulfovibrio spirochaetisodalis TaxID=1560234 RepID=A0A1B7XMV9_9BACT|nr:hypothetical protein [Halodesulfovibrio spirochaetisodalis]OBQ56852.1 hypothetical protein SP90_01980 [Halodesulfovibrio spirochaetisodalis]